MTQESLRDIEISIDGELEQLQDSGYLLIHGEELNDSPILLLEPPSQIAFVLHHVLGCKIEEAALRAGISEKQLREDLFSAYRQLVSREFGREVHFGDASAERASA